MIRNFTNILILLSTIFAAIIEVPNNSPTIQLGIDFVSNGFKIRSSGSGIGSATNRIYMAFAESPFKTANAR